MSEMVNIYLSYLRRGLGARTAAAPSGQRPRVNVRLRVVAEQAAGKAALGDRALEQPIQLYGPGDVLGFDAQKAVLRSRPATDEAHFNDNFIPFIEFADPDFLWRYSGHQAGKYWQPWLTLIVLETPSPDGRGGEFQYAEAREPGLPALIRLQPDAVLPDLRQSWRWAHTQLSAPRSLVEQPEKLRSYLQRHPQDAVCRLLAARRLKPDTGYAAFVVPTYRLGLEAALGMQSPQTRLTDYSWEGQAPEELPYYHHWTFRTGERGDFEDLVKRIQLHRSKGVGKKPVDVDHPGYGLSHWRDKEVQMEGALRSEEVEYDELGMDAPAYPQQADRDMAELLNRGENLEGDEQELRVVPPLYGRWFMAGPEAEVNIDPQKGNRSWFHQLNLDPRHRIAAGLGAQYVREHQEELMEAAWKQLEEIREINQDLNRVNFGAQVSACLYKRLLPPQPATPEEDAIHIFPILDQASEEEPRPDEPHSNLLFITAPLSEEIVIEEEVPEVPDGREKPRQRTLADKLQERGLPRTALANKARKYFRHRMAGKSPARMLHKLGKEGSVLPRELQPEGLTGKEEKEKTKHEDLLLFDHKEVLIHLGRETSDQLSPRKTITARMAERMASVRNWERRQKQGETGIQVTNFAAPPAEDPLRPVMAHPEFHAPMYPYLLGLSREYLAPGMEDIPENSLSFLFTNPRFIKSFMLGLNHEFAAELRWREFPTDMRGSYFRKFWDATLYATSPDEREVFRSSQAGEAFRQRLKEEGWDRLSWAEIEKAYFELTDPELGRLYEQALEDWLLTLDKHKDIPPIQEWAMNRPLESAPRGGQANDLVMLIRADLLKIYPNTHIFMARKNAAGRPDLQQKKMPIFEGDLPPDTYFMGFDIPQSKAKDYFLIFEERFSQENYGLDLKSRGTDTSYDNLAWSHFQDLGPGAYINDRKPAGSNSFETPAQIARHFRQKQVRVAIDMDYFLK